MQGAGLPRQYVPSAMTLIRAGLQDMDAARERLDQLYRLGLDDDRLRQLLDALSHAYDPDMALGHVVDIAQTCDNQEQGLRRWCVTGGSFARVIRVLGASETLGRTMRTHPALIAACAGEPDEVAALTRAQRRRMILERIGASPESAVPVAGLPLAQAASALRAAYREQVGAIAMVDVNADDPIDIEPRISRWLSDAVDAALEGALAIARREVASSAQVRFAVMGMGKLGAREINYVSDVDLIYVVEPADERVDASVPVRVGTRMATMLQKVCQSPITGCAEPPLWQIDGGLRPEGKDGPLVRRLASHLGYYEQWAQSWEFQALLKARPAAGDMALGEAYVAMLEPLVWSASKRENFVQDCRRMRQRVEELIPQHLKDRDIKLGRGGLRDVEFTVQMLQLVHGRTDASLRCRGTLEALDALRDGGYVSRTQAAKLSQDYRFERVLEHRQQLWMMQRTHLFPEVGACGGGLDRPREVSVDELNRSQPIRRLARVFGMMPEALVERFDATRREIRHLHLDIYYRPMLPISARLDDDQVALTEQAAKERFAAIGFADPDAAMRHVEALTAGVSRAAKINRIMLPAVLQWLAQGQNPDMGLLHWRTLEERFGTESEYLGFLRDSPSAAQRLCHVLSNSRCLGDALNRSVESVTWLGDDALLRPRSRESLDVHCQAALERNRRSMQDFATSIRMLRRREIERIGLGWINAVSDDDTCLAGMTDLTDAMVDAVLHWAVQYRMDEQGLAVAPADIAAIALGRYGGREMNFCSDADMMVVYQPTVAEPDAAYAGDGADGDADRDHAAQRFAKQVVDDLRAILQGPTTLEPKLELDMDLRPEGKHGPMVRSLASCREYYRSWASTWERQAMLRARAAAGDMALAQAVITQIIDPWRYPGEALSAAALGEIRTLKARMEAERLPRGVKRDRHVKLGRGGLSDVEWTVQLIQLQHAHAHEALRVTDTMAALRAEEELGLIAPRDAQVLRHAWRLCTAARNGIYLWTGRVAQADIVPDDMYSLGGVAVTVGYGANQGQRFDNDVLSAMRRCRDVMERLFYGA